MPARQSSTSSISRPIGSGVKLYTRQLGAAGRETYGNGVATDAIGDVFVAGSTNAGLDGNAQAGIYDFFVTKFSPEGDKQ